MTTGKHEYDFGTKPPAEEPPPIWVRGEPMDDTEVRQVCLRALHDLAISESNLFIRPKK